MWAIFGAILGLILSQVFIGILMGFSLFYGGIKAFFNKIGEKIDRLLLYIQKKLFSRVKNDFIRERLSIRFFYIVYIIILGIIFTLVRIYLNRY